MASQVNHFKEFATQADYEAYIQPDNYAKPLVALIDATGTVMFPQGGGGGGGGNPILTSVDVADFTGTTFSNYYNYITDVTIPSTVTAIGQDAFYLFKSLASIDIPSGVTSIGAQAFRNCTSLVSVNGLGNTSVNSIGNFAFRDCIHLVSIDLPSTLTTLGSSGVFYGCTSLVSVNGLGNTSVTSIGEQVFYGCGFTTFSVPERFTSIGNQTFSGCLSLASVDLPSTLTTIGPGCFSYCTALTSIDIPSGVTSIGAQAFRNCSSLTSVTVRATTPPTLGSNAFQSTNANLVIYVPAASVADYQAASGWSTYASQIQAIPSA